MHVTNLDTYRETAQRKPKLRATIIEDRNKNLATTTETRGDNLPGITGDPRRIKAGRTIWTKRR